MDISDYMATDSTVFLSVMLSNLNDKASDAFDNIFLIEMSMHHQRAINMAKVAATQPKHINVISTQTSKIHKMQQLQCISPTE